MSSVPAVVIEARKFPSDIEAYFVDLMQKHGIHVRVLQEALQLVFPAGTIKKRAGTYVVHNVEYTLMLPDGFMLSEYVPTDRRMKSGIAFQITDVPQYILKAHPKGVCDNH